MPAHQGWVLGAPAGMGDRLPFSMRWSASCAPACSSTPSAVHRAKLIMENRHTLFSQLTLIMGLSSLDSHMALP